MRSCNTSVYNFDAFGFGMIRGHSHKVYYAGEYKTFAVRNFS